MSTSNPRVLDAATPEAIQAVYNVFGFVVMADGELDDSEIETINNPRDNGMPTVGALPVLKDWASRFVESVKIVQNGHRKEELEMNLRHIAGDAVLSQHWSGFVKDMLTISHSDGEIDAAEMQTIREIHEAFVAINGSGDDFNGLASNLQDSLGAYSARLQRRMDGNGIAAHQNMMNLALLVCASDGNVDESEIDTLNNPHKGIIPLSFIHGMEHPVNWTEAALESIKKDLQVQIDENAAAIKADPDVSEEDRRLFCRDLHALMFADGEVEENEIVVLSLIFRALLDDEDALSGFSTAYSKDLESRGKFIGDTERLADMKRPFLMSSAKPVTAKAASSNGGASSGSASGAARTGSASSAPTTSGEMSYFDHYVACWKRYAEFSGRSSKKQYWSFALINLAVAIVVSIISPTLGSLYQVAVMVPGVAAAARRMHDIGKSGWVLLVSFIPLVGLILIYWALQDSEQGVNKWGDCPSD